MPMLPPLGARSAVLIPISSPFRLSSVPLELPQLIDQDIGLNKVLKALPD